MVHNVKLWRIKVSHKEVNLTTVQSQTSSILIRQTGQLLSIYQLRSAHEAQNLDVKMS